MPLISSDYRPKWPFVNPHFNTAAPTLFRQRSKVPYQRQMLELADGDCLAMDQLLAGRKEHIVICHGLEGHSRRPYVSNLAMMLFRQGYDVTAWNFRSCGGLMNRLPRFYHSGDTEDLRAVINRLLQQGVQHLHLVGFSMGGNLLLNYLGKPNAAEQIRSAVALSVPCDLVSSAERLRQRENRFYMQRFLRFLTAKIRAKAQIFPEHFNLAPLEQIKDFHGFDQAYTAPLHGFASALDYWQQCSANRFLANIAVPSLLINARDDSFLTPECFPIELARESEYLHLEIPNAGGHVGFMRWRFLRPLWSERRILEFIQQHSPILSEAI